MEQPVTKAEFELGLFRYHYTVRRLQDFPTANQQSSLIQSSVEWRNFTLEQCTTVCIETLSVDGTWRLPNAALPKYPFQ
jgi:hypothetical protein